MTAKPIEIAGSIIDTVAGVTKDWTKKRKAEERDRNRQFRRHHYLVPDDRFTICEAALDGHGRGLC
jgi:hypothetical protein